VERQKKNTKKKKKMEELAVSWRGLHDEELHNLHVSPDNIRVIECRKHAEEHFG
jgi:hypothetical protein